MSEPPRLRVMSFNIHAGRPAAGRTDLAAVARVIREADPDLCALQEVLRWPAPYTALDQPSRLSRLTGLHARFRPSFGLGPLGFGNAVLSRVKAVSLRRYRLPGRGEPRALLQAGLLWHGIRVWFLNTHLSLSSGDRLRQAAWIAGHLRDLEGPVLLAGDWNCGPDGEEASLIQEAGLRLCTGPELLSFPSDAPQHQLDHLAVSPHFEVERCRTVPTLASDHRPLVADLTLT